jgi:hypothetical protein
MAPRTSAGARATWNKEGARVRQAQRGARGKESVMSPSLGTGAKLGGSRWAQPAQRGSDRGAMRARDTAAGVTAQQARRPPRAARLRSRGSASLRPTCHSAATGAAVEPARARIASCGPAAGMAGGRGTIWHVRSARSKAQRSGAQRRARAAGQFVKRDRRSRTRDGHQGPRPPAMGRAAFVMTAGTAGLTVLREGWKPVRVKTRSGSMRSTTARPRAAGRRPARTTSAAGLERASGLW